jgi:hypothetical protein
MMIMLVMVDEGNGGNDDDGGGDRGTTHPLSSFLYLQEYPSSCLSSAVVAHTWQWKESYYPNTLVKCRIESRNQAPDHLPRLIAKANFANLAFQITRNKAFSCHHRPFNLNLSPSHQ